MKTIIDSIESKISDLLLKHNQLKNQKSDLQKENYILTKKVNDQQIKITSLLDKVKLMNISKSAVKSHEDVRATRSKINEYVREIDKCIALLNK